MGNNAAADSNLEEIIHLLPNEILVEERYNVRPWTTSDAGASELEAKKIEQMADSIEQLGQLDAGIVEPSKTKSTDGKEQFVLYAGHRRRKAIALVNERRAGRGQSLIHMRLAVDRSGGDTKRKAAQSNLQRNDNNPMDLALLIDSLRKEHGWGYDMAGHKHVMKYLNLSLSTVTQHQRFLKADPDIQKRLADGQISAKFANDLMVGVKPHMLPEVLKNAERIQTETDKQQAERNEGFVKSHGSKEQRAELKKKNKEESGQTDKTDSKPRRIKAPALVKALRETEGAMLQAQPKTRKEIIEIFEEIADGPAYGPEDSPARLWARYFVDKWQSGNGTDKTFISKFDEMTGVDAGLKKKNEKLAASLQEESDRLAKLEADKLKAEKAAKKKKPARSKTTPPDSGVKKSAKAHKHKSKAKVSRKQPAKQTQTELSATA